MVPRHLREDRPGWRRCTSSDWCDTGECHNYDKADTTNGRIYRVVYGTPKPWKGDVSKLTDAELVKLQLHPNDWFVRQARRVLQERAAAGKLEKGTPDALQEILKDEKDVSRRLRALWAWTATGRYCRRTSIIAAHREQRRCHSARGASGCRARRYTGDRRHRQGATHRRGTEREASEYVRLHVARRRCSQPSRASHGECARSVAAKLSARVRPATGAGRCWYARCTIELTAPAEVPRC